MFSRDHHNLIETVLESLNSELLRDTSCYFGGGTAIALRFGEFRESIDVDFMVSSAAGYRTLRELIKSSGFKSIMVHQVPLVRDPVADQYGIRAILDVGGTPIKFEIVSEGRISFEIPGRDDEVCGVATLSLLDMATSKLLANSDRWADTSVFSRDLIDLAMMEPSNGLMDEAVDKAEGAYGSSVVRDLDKAIDYHRDNPHRLDQCIRELKMDSTPKALLWDRIQRLYR
ncbi:nucleotidyl transferase AbiEii/AbiGii toxin family protein [Rhodococcus qingshengii]|uniref:nucleotidyl transferase AbiEii/AbiGii toxin family protein n=1 Tax=Rhodococcus qingshengii TaxID=334542 RepID=UPI0021B0B383|nr:nucleotidyl transferase AbiEii/AbiGii toxin family protein [Rhodococcus qingshengii]MCT6735255.1 nucleotidyl transferase AbiEii/AbiGii toxin family protein [Rhodococcus qingshengii]